VGEFWAIETGEFSVVITTDTEAEILIES
jgi:hypothetical protein